MRIKISDELKRLDGTFLSREVAAPRTIVDRRGNDKEVMTLVWGIDFLGLGFLELKPLIKILKVFKQTGIKTIDIEKHPKGGISITFDRAAYFIRDIGNG